MVEPHDTRAGLVAVVGPPNVGKSTLLNAVLGEHLSAVSRKEQTTRRPLRGIWTKDDAQIVLVDTPGLLDPGDPLQETLVDASLAALDGVDAVYVLADRADVPAAAARVFATLARADIPVFLVVTKIDRLAAKAVGEIEAAWRAVFPWAAVFHVSATTGAGLDPLLSATAARMPAQPFLYPADELTDTNMRAIAAELVREACYEELGEELPYSIHVVIDDWKDPGADGATTTIRATIFVERASQKGMVIGKKGRKLKAIGTRARRSIEPLVGGPIHLALWVKVRKKWSRREEDLKLFGYLR